METDDFLRLAIDITVALGKLHRRGLLHGYQCMGPALTPIWFPGWRNRPFFSSRRIAWGEPIYKAANDFQQHVTFDWREAALRRDGHVRPVGGRALDILLYLADRPGKVIAKQELIDHVRSGVTVEEGSLLAAIRKALGDGQFSNRYVANVRARGYSFVAPSSLSLAVRRARATGPDTKVLMMIGRETPSTPRAAVVHVEQHAHSPVIEQDAPMSCAAENAGRIVHRSILGGLHHRT